VKKIIIVFRHAPHGKAHSREGLDLALLSASFEQDVSLVFVDDGVLNLLAQQDPTKIGGRDFIATFKALPFYDIEKAFVCQGSLSSRGLTIQDCFIPVEAISYEAIRQLFETSDEVLVY
jgi:tRNA 2-thiouridine synthesizing protein C